MNEFPGQDGQSATSLNCTTNFHVDDNGEYVDRVTRLPQTAPPPKLTECAKQ